MDKPIGMAQAKSKLAELVGRVVYGGERFVLERWGKPVAVLISVEEYRRLQELAQAAGERPLPPDLRRRQEQLVAQSRRLRVRLGDPVDGLVELLSTLPSEDNECWVQLAEVMPYVATLDRDRRRVTSFGVYTCLC